MAPSPLSHFEHDTMRHEEDRMSLARGTLLGLNFCASGSQLLGTREDGLNQPHALSAPFPAPHQSLTPFKIMSHVKSTGKCP